mgnify:CR=1 FL=1
MFGYVRPCKPELLVKEFESYRGVYCSLCKQLGKSFGVLSRMTLSYDCTFLAMLCLSLENVCPGFHRGRCVANPLKKCTYCTGGEESFVFAAAVSVLMTYHKVKDDLHDSRFFGKLRAALLLPVAAHAGKKAKKRFPEVEAVVVDAMADQAAAEQDPQTEIDAAADPTARMLASLLKLRGSDEQEKTALEQFGYFLGRWIYLMDAADDIEKDKKQGSFNPFVRKQQSDSSLGGEALRTYCNEVLNQTVSQAILHFEQLHLRQFAAILSNIVTLGLPAMQKEILFEREKKHGRSI